MTESPSLEGFAEKLLSDRGVGDISSEVIEQMKKDLVSRLEDRINAAMIEKLAPQYLEEAERLIDDGDDAKVQQFFTTHLSNMSEIISTELLLFRDRYLNPA